VGRNKAIRDGMAREKERERNFKDYLGTRLVCAKTYQQQSSSRQQLRNWWMLLLLPAIQCGAKMIKSTTSNDRIVVSVREEGTKAPILRYVCIHSSHAGTLTHVHAHSRLLRQSHSSHSYDRLFLAHWHTADRQWLVRHLAAGRRKSILVGTRSLFGVKYKQQQQLLLLLDCYGSQSRNFPLFLFVLTLHFHYHPPSHSPSASSVEQMIASNVGSDGNWKSQLLLLRAEMNLLTFKRLKCRQHPNYLNNFYPDVPVLESWYKAPYTFNASILSPGR